MENELAQLSNNTASDKKKSLAAILAFFLCFIGAHRFYVGKIPTAIFQLLTFGGCFLWAIADFLIIIFGEFKDSDGRKLQ